MPTLQPFAHYIFYDPDEVFNSTDEMHMLTIQRFCVTELSSLTSCYSWQTKVL